MKLIHITFLLTIAISISIIIPTSGGIAQSLRVDDKIGGGGTSGSSSSSSSGNSFIYIAGGAVIAGVIVYALLRDKSDKKGKSGSDSSKVSLNNLLQDDSTVEIQMKKLKDSLPINFYFGMSDQQAFISEKKYSLGVSFRL
jgi:hypothetical protein